MPSPLAQHLAERFASDARALRARASALAAAGRAPQPPSAKAPNGPGGRPPRGRGPAPRPAGPSAESTERMALACDRVEALFAGAETDEAVRALMPTLAGMVSGARTSEETYVYAGAVSRLTEALGGGGDDEPDDSDDEDDA